jgi:galactose mutarotase-like enzyme
MRNGRQKMGADVGAQRFVQLTNDILSVEISGNRGADLTSIFDRRTNQEILWKKPNSSPNFVDNAPNGGSSTDEFYDMYQGGIQELFPNTGAECVLDGAPLLFHGEASRISWEVLATKEEKFSKAECRTQLLRYPFDLERTVTLPANSDLIYIESRVRNRSARVLPVSWGFHPVFSAAITEGPSQFYFAASEIKSHPGPFGTTNAYGANEYLDLDSRKIPELDAIQMDLKRGDAQNADLLFINCNEGWYSVRNQSNGLTFSMAWDSSLLPYIWLWEECKDRSGYPWWGERHIVGIEPHSSPHDRGLAASILDSTAIQIQPFETKILKLVLQINITSSKNEAIEQGRLLLPKLEDFPIHQRNEGTHHANATA